MFFFRDYCLVLSVLQCLNIAVPLFLSSFSLFKSRRIILVHDASLWFKKEVSVPTYMPMEHILQQQKSSPKYSRNFMHDFSGKHRIGLHFTIWCKTFCRFLSIFSHGRCFSPWAHGIHLLSVNIVSLVYALFLFLKTSHFWKKKEKITNGTTSN